MKIIKCLFLIGCSLVLTSLEGCYYDKNEKLHPKAYCDTSSVITYNLNVKPVMEQNCTVCHSGTTPSAGLNLDSYNAVKNCAVSGKLYSSITWDGTTPKMPQGSSEKIDNCSIMKIKKWMDSNYAQ
ncbi:MAG: hypothetical protein H0W61_02980 [Bacteroidetes bacterium]|nr:hypothetical protein [Bacteroidota bacterium]